MAQQYHRASDENTAGPHKASLSRYRNATGRRPAPHNISADVRQRRERERCVDVRVRAPSPGGLLDPFNELVVVGGVLFEDTPVLEKLQRVQRCIHFEAGLALVLGNRTGAIRLWLQIELVFLFGGVLLQDENACHDGRSDAFPSAASGRVGNDRLRVCHDGRSDAFPSAASGRVRNDCFRVWHLSGIRVACFVRRGRGVSGIFLVHRFGAIDEKVRYRLGKVHIKAP